MAGASKKTREELLETQFVDRRIPPQHITAEVALDYFMQPENDFFDRTSNNQRVRQQNFNKLDPAKLRAMRGTEYERIFSQGWALHIIQKQCRLGPDRSAFAGYWECRRWGTGDGTLCLVNTPCAPAPRQQRRWMRTTWYRARHTSAQTFPRSSSIAW